MSLFGWLGGLLGKKEQEGGKAPSRAVVEEARWEDMRDVCLAFYANLYGKLRNSWGENLTGKIISSSIKGAKIADFFSGNVLLKERLDDWANTIDEPARFQSLSDNFQAFLESLYKSTENCFGEEVTKQIFIRSFMDECGSFLSYDGKVAFSVMPKSLLSKIIQMTKVEVEENIAAIVYVMGLIKDRESMANAKKISMGVSKANPLEVDESTLVEAFLEMEKMIVSYGAASIPYGARELKEEVAKNIRTESLGPKMRFLLSLGWGDKVLPIEDMFSSIARECLSLGMDRRQVETLIKDFTKGTLWEGVSVKKSGVFFDSINQKFYSLPEVWSSRVSEDGMRIILQAFSYTQNIWGKKIAEQVIAKSYVSVKERYGHSSDMKVILRALPRGVLEEEKIELMSKDELEKLGKEMARGEAIKEEFINVMAHELKTPLIPIIGYLSMILENEKAQLPNEIREKLKTCLNAAQREQKMVDDLLDITKLESGAMKFEKKDLKVKELVHGAVAGFETKAMEKGLEFIVEVVADGEIIGDERRLTQVIDNLLTNAIKFTDRGLVKVTGYTKGDDFVLTVTDTGKGIKNESIRMLFTKFFQEGGEKRNMGTGLGLAICREIVEAHGGKIWVESEEGKGSSFSFAIPMKK